MTIRLRLLVYYSGLLMMILALFGVAVFGLLRWTMLSQVDSTLDRVLDDVLDDTGGMMVTGPDGQPQLTAYVPRLDTFRTPGVYVQIWEVYREERLFSASENLGNFTDSLDPGAVGSDEEWRSDVTINDTHLRVITKPIMVEDQIVGNVQAAASLTTIEAATDRLLKIMLGGGIIALLLSLLLGDWLARRTLRPVASVVSAAQSITAADDLARRIPYPGPMHDELGRMVNAFNETLARLEQLFWAQRRFVGDVSHELRTPLTTIQGNVDLMRMYGSDPKSMSILESEIKRMVRLVDDLLLLARADSGDIPIETERIDLDRLLLEIYNEAIVISKNRHTVKLGQFDQVQVQASADRLKQLYLNLVTNAIKYTPEGGAITISLSDKGGYVVTKVADTGVGIPPDDLKNIFDRFYRVDEARTRATGGTGLGLSIAQWIAEVHGGQIGVESEVDKGTTFIVTLPTDHAPQAPHVPPEPQTRMRFVLDNKSSSQS